MLDAFALIFLQEFLDLAMFVLAFIERDADLVVRGGHGARNQRGLLALDIEITDLTEIEDPFVETGPMVHAAAIHIMGQVIQRVQADGVLVRRSTRDRREIDVIDGAAAGAVDQIQVRPADPLDCGDIQLARAVLAADRGCAAFQRQFQRLGGIGDAECHGVGGGAVRLAEIGDLPGGVHVEQEIDVALGIAADILGFVIGDMGEAHGREQVRQRLRIGAGELDELEAVEAERVGIGSHWESASRVWGSFCETT